MQEIRSLPASLKAIANMIEDTRHALRELESRINSQDAGLERLEAELERQFHVQDRSSKEIHKLKQELEALKAGPTAKVPAETFWMTPAISVKSQNSLVNAEPAVPDPQPAAAAQAPVLETGETVKLAASKKNPVSEINIPIMNGIGFSQITVDYLKNLGKKA
jgi:uncharacterized coiled-coil protein SlyX